MVVAHNLNQARKARDGNKKNRTIKEPEKTENTRQSTSQGSHVKSFSTKVQRLLLNRTSRQEPGQSERQSWTHNQSTPQRCEKDTNDRKNLSAVRGGTSWKSERRKKSSTTQ